MAAQAIWQPAYVALGSNLENPERQVRDAWTRLHGLPETRAVLLSRLYGSRPLGPVRQPDFINAVAGLVTRLSPEALLAELRAIESGMGRPVERERWGPRVIDLDLLALGQERRAGPELTLPHPGVGTRNFVLLPLAEFAAAAQLPGLGSVGRLAAAIDRAGLEVLA